MIFAGFMADDGNFAAVGPMLATLMGVPHATTAVRFAKENGTVRVERELEGGALEVVELTAPCLVTTQTGMNQVRYASLKGIMAAKKKPLDVKSVADLGLAGQVGEAAAKVKVEKLYMPARGQGAEMLSGSVDEVVNKLVGKIKELGLL
jgi:electron transfer flavoprotein beta subunit